MIVVLAAKKWTCKRNVAISLAVARCACGFSGKEADLSENYCRNIGGGAAPWCYIDKDTCTRQYCEPCGLSKLTDETEVTTTAVMMREMMMVKVVMVHDDDEMGDDDDNDNRIGDDLGSSSRSRRSRGRVRR